MDKPNIEEVNWSSPVGNIRHRIRLFTAAASWNFMLGDNLDLNLRFRPSSWLNSELLFCFVSKNFFVSNFEK